MLRSQNKNKNQQNQQRKKVNGSLLCLCVQRLRTSPPCFIFRLPLPFFFEYRRKKITYREEKNGVMPFAFEITYASNRLFWVCCLCFVCIRVCVCGSVIVFWLELFSSLTSPAWMSGMGAYAPYLFFFLHFSPFTGCSSILSLFISPNACLLLHVRLSFISCFFCGRFEPPMLLIGRRHLLTHTQAYLELVLVNTISKHTSTFVPPSVVCFLSPELW